jgi:hypothetical protein
MRTQLPREHADRVLLLEVVLALLLFGLFIGLYFVPAGGTTFRPQWWAWPVMAALFFGILLLDRWRRKRRRRTGLSNAIPDTGFIPPNDVP